MEGECVLKASNLEVHRGNMKIFDNLSISLMKGEVVALVGDNGSGKTTIIESLCGITTLKQGEVYWATESDVYKLIRDSEGRRNPPPPMGLTLQDSGICGEETVSERLLTSLSVSGLNANPEAISELLTHWDLNHRANSRISQLSRGLKRRLSVLCGLAPVALSDSERIAILDEPSEGLDTKSKDLLIKWIKTLSNLNNTILISTHDREIINCASRVLEISNGILLEEKGKNLGNPCEIPESISNKNQEATTDLIKWAFRMEYRNPIDTIGKATPAIVALLLAYALVGKLEINSDNSNLLAALVLAPSFITCISSPALATRLMEDGSGKWWNAMVGPMSRVANSVCGASLLLPIPLAYLSWFVLVENSSSGFSSEVIVWLWLPALAMIDLAIAATGLHLLVFDLRRANATPSSLLLVTLAWPFLELTDALSTVMTNGMTFELELHNPIITCLIASITSAMIWAAAIFIPEY